MSIGPPSVAYKALIDERRRELRNVLSQALPRGKQFTWEVGCGHGHFLTAYAKAHPEKSCVGVDLVGERIERALRKRDRAKLPNLHFIRAEAGFFLETLPSDTLFSELFLLFPDPWPKLRHHKHRVIQPAFLTLAAAHATKNCLFCFRTDFEPYFDEACGVVDQHESWHKVDELWPFEFETVFQSRAAGHRSLVARRRP